MIKLISIYKYPVTIVFFIVWMLFFDSNSVVFMYKQYKELQGLTAQEEFLKTEIDEMKEQKEELFSSDEKLEKYAREHYYFKKDNEDIYVLELSESK